jgi:hypothetical protein
VEGIHVLAGCAMEGGDDVTLTIKEDSSKVLFQLIDATQQAKASNVLSKTIQLTAEGSLTSSPLTSSPITTFHVQVKCKSPQFTINPICSGLQ